jgi:hypothetical protein
MAEHTYGQEEEVIIVSSWSVLTMRVGAAR